jgi:hypothetical protein
LFSAFALFSLLLRNQKVLEDFLLVLDVLVQLHDDLMDPQFVPFQLLLLVLDGVGVLVLLFLDELVVEVLLIIEVLPELAVVGHIFIHLL